MSLKVSYELDKLKDIVEERHRLVADLGMAPSKSDSVALKQQLNTVLELLNDNNLEPEFEVYQEEYNDLLDGYLGEDKDIDLGLYRFVPPTKTANDTGKNRNSEERASVSEEDLLGVDPNQKKVRFNEDPETFHEEEPETSSLAAMTFQPYHDYEEDQEEGHKPDSKRYQDSRISNDELFARQQQQLLEQDSQLDTLAGTVHTTHGISVDINQEITDQNEHVLDDLENMLDSSSRNLDRAQRRLTNFTNTARENGPCSIIVLLTIILFFLLVIL